MSVVQVRHVAQAADQLGHIGNHHGPKRIVVDAEIAMDQTISGGHHHSPGHLRMFRTYKFRHMTRGLADKFKIAYRRVVDQAVGDKTLLVKSAGVIGNFLGKVNHVVNVETPFARTGFRHGRPLSR